MWGVTPIIVDNDNIPEVNANVVSWRNTAGETHSWTSVAPDITSTVKIPKLIMQTWKNHQIPEHWQESPASIREHMPNWTYVLMTDNDNDAFCAKYFPDFLRTYRKFPHAIQRADAIRCLWLYVYGGLYMDLDIVIIKPLDSLFYPDSELYLCSSGNIGSYLTNSFMASKPRCGLWLKMVQYMKLPAPWWAWGKHMEVMNTTGPIALNYVVKTRGYSYVALPSKGVMPCSVCDIERCNYEGAYLRPLVGSSWVSWDTRVMNFFMCNWKTVVIVIILIVIILLIYAFSSPSRSSEKREGERRHDPMIAKY